MKTCLLSLVLLCALFDAALLAAFLLRGEWGLAAAAFCLAWLAFFAGVLCERSRFF